jgi:DNA-binding transcriptional LysR family regulator
MHTALDPDFLRTFLAITETGSYDAAGKRVHKTQSAVSAQIKRLEEILDTRLFVKSGRRNNLTASGRRLLEYAHAMVRLNEEIVGAFRPPEISGRLRVGTSDDHAQVFFPDVLESFARTHPAVQVEVVTATSMHLIPHMETEDFDLLVVARRAGDQGDGSSAPGQAALDRGGGIDQPVRGNAAFGSLAGRVLLARYGPGRTCTGRTRLAPCLYHLQWPATRGNHAQRLRNNGRARLVRAVRPSYSRRNERTVPAGARRGGHHEAGGQAYAGRGRLQRPPACAFSLRAPHCSMTCRGGAVPPHVCGKNVEFCGRLLASRDC